ncbi:hypothetical protein CEE37_04415 [candidate division LCP-89 bacterium B3_LCP]|uniref:Lipoprotein n=1 Tax=candidate division LCP-89 bacterium B3_LCP TaxID=2012998 RepID=A0A532V3U5_UNCL8|nr:MAG: hypothetical protein CEE37_04415 [candidate division LCP-89 bacterium B3_LCP]
MQRIIITASVLCAISFSFSSCLNPFAPVLGNPSSSVWTEAQTVGELLDNFKNSYNFQDSLRYADCLDESFVFVYYDVIEEREDQWGRDTDLKTTGGLFSNFEEIHLIWYALPENISDFAEENTSLEFDASFSLSLYGYEGGSTYDLYGFANFTVEKEAGDRFRIITWKDITIF